ncbi:MAG: YihY family inner membrane protein [Betaproteobacteria bacterium]|nr:YihY family inner membrane protein [Betaproteobacteria bacterium]
MIVAVKPSQSPHGPIAPETLGSSLAPSKASAWRRWPWKGTLRVLGQRFREDRLGLTAGSLTFTTLISLVPLLTVMLAVFTAFPMFSSFQVALEKYFLQNLVPDSIARPVLAALTQFASKAHRIGVMGLFGLVVTALALMLTIDHTLNRIWRVPRPRPLGQRVLIYWAALTLGPLLLGASLTLTSYAFSVSAGWVRAMPSSMSQVAELIQFLLFTASVAGLFHYVPNTQVRWTHAWAGALFVSIAFELAKKGLAWYVSAVPAYATIYGAFAAVPILLLWIYLVWLIVLWGAVIAAYAPSLTMGVTDGKDLVGQDFSLGVSLLSCLDAARQQPDFGSTCLELARQTQSDPLRVAQLLERMMHWGWVRRLEEDSDPGSADGAGARYVLLADPSTTLAQPMLDACLAAPHPALDLLRQRWMWHRLTLRDLIR